MILNWLSFHVDIYRCLFCHFVLTAFSPVCYFLLSLFLSFHSLLFLFVSVSLSLFLYRSLSIYICISFSLVPCLPVCLSLSLSLSLCLGLSHLFSLSLTHKHTLSLHLCLADSSVFVCVSHPAVHLFRCLVSYTRRSPFGLDIDQVGRNIISMSVSGFVFFALTLALEYNIFSKLAARIKQITKQRYVMII